MSKVANAGMMSGIMISLAVVLSVIVDPPEALMAAFENKPSGELDVQIPDPNKVRDIRDNRHDVINKGIIKGLPKVSASTEGGANAVSTSRRSTHDRTDVLHSR